MRRLGATLVSGLVAIAACGGIGGERPPRPVDVTMLVPLDRGDAAATLTKESRDEESLLITDQEISSWITRGIGDEHPCSFGQLDYSDGCTLLRELQNAALDPTSDTAECLHSTRREGSIDGYDGWFKCRRVYYKPDTQYDCRPKDSRRDFEIPETAITCGLSRVTPELSSALYSYINRCFADGWKNHSLRQTMYAKGGFEREIEQRILTRATADGGHEVVEMCGTPYLKTPERGADAGAPAYGWVWNLWVYPASKKLDLSHLSSARP